MVEKLHQLYQCQFGTLTTIHVVNLSPECLTQGVTAKVTDFQTVLLFQVFQNAVDPLDAESGTFLTNQDRLFNADRLDMGKTILDVLL